MNRVSVSSDVLQWALERSRRTADDLESRFPKFRKWLSGHEKPTLRQLEQLATATATPFGYFFLAKPLRDKLPIPHYRTIEGSAVERPSTELIDTIQEMERRQAWLREFLIDEGDEALPFVASVKPQESTANVAKKMRVALGFTDEWASAYKTWGDALRALRDAIEATGIVVVINGIVGNNTHRKLDVDEFRGFVLVDDIAPLVFVNGSDAKSAQMFTLAHELAHVLFGSSAAFDLRRLAPANDAVERACNSAAAEFFVPADRLRALWPTIKSQSSPFEAIARRFKVSQIVAARRALDLGLIKAKEFEAFYLEYIAREHERPAPTGGDFYLVQPQRIGARLAAAIIRAIRSGKLLYTDAYRLTGLRGQTFEHFVATFTEGGV